MQERLLTFGPEGLLVGTLALPSAVAGSERPAGAGRLGVLFVNAGLIHRVGPHRIYVKWARACARAGVPSLRFDLAGIGDSRGVHGRTDARRGVPDIALAAEQLCREAGCDGVVLVGICAGAIQSFYAASELPAVRGAVLVDCWIYPTVRSRVRRLLGKLREPGRLGRAWRALGRGVARAAGRPQARGDRTPDWLVVHNPPLAEFRAALGRALGREAALYFVYTRTFRERYNYDAQLADAAGAVARSPLLRVERWADATHTFIGLAEQRAAAGRLLEWLAGVREPAAQSASSAASAAGPPVGTRARTVPHAPAPAPATQASPPPAAVPQPRVPSA